MTVEILLNLFNIITFFIAIISFFWFVVSKQFNIIIVEKLGIFISLCKKDETFKENIHNYLKSEYVKYIYYSANIHEQNRNSYNYDLLTNELFPYLYVLIILIVINIFYIIYKRITINKNDLLLFILMFLGFFTEVIFYFVVINEWKYVGDFELLLLVLA